MKKRDKEKVDKNDYSAETVKAKRKFPKKNVILLSILVVIQVAFVLVGVLYVETPDDSIVGYIVTFTPRADGSIDIAYDITWRTITDTEALTWVTVGIPNGNATLYDFSVSDTVDKAEVVAKRKGTSYVRLDFKDDYIGGEVASHLKV